MAPTLSPVHRRTENVIFGCFPTIRFYALLISKDPRRLRRHDDLAMVYKFVMVTKNETLRSQDFAGRGGALHVLGNSSLPPVWA